MLENRLRVLQGLGQAGRDIPVHAAGPQLRRHAAHGRARDGDGARRDELRARSTGPCPTVPAKQTDGTPGVQFKVIEARADSLAQDPEIVWKNLSSTATLTYPGGAPQPARLARPEGHPADRRLRDGALRRPPVPGRPRRLPRPQARGGVDRDQARGQDQRPGPTRARPSTSSRRSPTASCSRTGTVPSRDDGERAVGRDASIGSRSPRRSARRSRTPRCRPRATRPATGSTTAGTSSRATRSTTASTARARR